MKTEDKLKFIKVDDKSIASVAELALDIWRKHYVPIIGEAQVEYMLKNIQSESVIKDQIDNEGYAYYLMESEGMVVGYLAVIPKDDELFLSKLYVSEENRGKGFGRMALDFIDNIARERNLPKITLTVSKKNKSSIRIYEKLGFVNISPIVIDIGGGFVMDDYKMEKTVL